MTASSPASAEPAKAGSLSPSSPRPSGDQESAIVADELQKRRTEEKIAQEKRAKRKAAEAMNVPSVVGGQETETASETEAPIGKLLPSDPTEKLLGSTVQMKGTVQYLEDRKVFTVEGRLEGADEPPFGRILVEVLRPTGNFRYEFKREAHRRFDDRTRLTLSRSYTRIAAPASSLENLCFEKCRVVLYFEETTE
jgi:hypothetical protein